MPPPVPLKWLSSDNDRLYREADVIVVTVPGSGHPDTVGLINRTSLGLMRDGAHDERSSCPSAPGRSILATSRRC